MRIREMMNFDNKGTCCVHVLNRLESPLDTGGTLEETECRGWSPIPMLMLGLSPLNVKLVAGQYIRLCRRRAIAPGTRWKHDPATMRRWS